MTTLPRRLAVGVSAVPAASWLCTATRRASTRTVWLTVFALVLAVSGLLPGAARGEEVIPQKPTRYFNDYAMLVKPETADRLNRELEDLEKQSSNQILAVIYPKMQSDSDVNDYCQRVARAWQVGGKEHNNGVVLFVFVENHKAAIQVGYGLEGAIPDAVAKRITADEVSARFKQQDFDGGMSAGVESLIKASKGEYQGTGTTQNQRDQAGDGDSLGVGTIIMIVLVLFVLFGLLGRRSGGAMYTGGGPTFFGGGFSSGGGSSSSSSSSGDSGGGFSSGGGDFGGGGASSDW